MKKILLASVFSLFTTFAIASPEDVFNKVKDSVVTVHNNVFVESDSTTVDKMFSDFSKTYHFDDKKPVKSESMLGSGYIITNDGIMVTNYHVIKNIVEFSYSLEIEFSNGEIINATEIGHDERSDIAVLKINNNHNFIPVDFGDSSLVNVGEEILAIGSPLGLDQTLTRGIVSAKNRIVNHNVIKQFQIDAAINHGNSGGPLFNKDGKVIGMNAEIMSTTNANIGLGFSIPSNAIKTIVDNIIKNKKYVHGSLGVEIIKYDNDINQMLEIDGADNINGALITYVMADKPAFNKLFRGDIITEVNGKIILDSNDFMQSIYLNDLDKEVKIKFLRNSKFMEIKILPKV